MNEVLFFLASSFWAGAAHAATPGHGKTIAAAYIVGARGKPIDALILGIFVTLSHTSGIVVVGVLASIGSTWLRPQRVEAYMGLIVGVVVIALGLWMLWTQRDLLALAMGGPDTQDLSSHSEHSHDQGPAHDHDHHHADPDRRVDHVDHVNNDHGLQPATENLRAGDAALRRRQGRHRGQGAVHQPDWKHLLLDQRVRERAGRLRGPRRPGHPAGRHL